MPRIAHVSAIVLILVALSRLSVAQSEPVTPDVIPQLIGQWTGEGELFGRPAMFSMAWDWELDGQFLRLSFENRIVEKGEARTVLRATAYYRLGDDGRFRGTWFDTRGQVLELRATAMDQTLVTHWFAESEQGRTRYRVIDENTIETQDDVLGNEGWRIFGKTTYRRAEGE